MAYDVATAIKMSVQSYQERAKRIIQFFQQHNDDIQLTINHFKEENVPERSIRDVVNRFLKEGRVDFKPKTGRPSTVDTKTNRKRVKLAYLRKPSRSVRNTGERLNINYSSVQRIKKKLGFRTSVKKKRPVYKKNQEERARKGSKYIYNKMVPSGGDLICVMDDETYVPADPDQVPGREFYSELLGRPLDDDRKVKKKEKFCEKFLVWQAISSDGQVCEPFIMKGSMNSDVYLKECVRKRLIPFIESIGAENVLF